MLWNMPRADSAPWSLTREVQDQLRRSLPQRREAHSECTDFGWRAAAPSLAHAGNGSKQPRQRMLAHRGLGVGNKVGPPLQVVVVVEGAELEDGLRLVAARRMSYVTNSPRKFAMEILLAIPHWIADTWPHFRKLQRLQGPGVLETHK